MTYPVFTNGTVLPASDLNAIGLWLVKSQTVGSGVSSVTVTGAFSADFDNYFITWTGGTQSADTNTTLQLGSTTTGYYGFFSYGVDVSPTPLGVGNSNASSFVFFGGGNSTGAQCAGTLYGPNLAKPTFLHSDVAGYSTVHGSYNARENSTTQHTAFSIIPNSGTMTGGTVRVYGYRN
jgi:hypothetical protein